MINEHIKSDCTVHTFDRKKYEHSINDNNFNSYNSDKHTNTWKVYLFSDMEFNKYSSSESIITKTIKLW
jgi:hypothetical protein